MAFLSTNQLRELGLISFGENVLISEKASIYGARRIHIGSHVRIDDFCVLSAGESGIRIGSYIHIACYSSLIGKEHIDLEDFANISSRVAIYSSSDDYSGTHMSNPMVPPEYTNVDHRPVKVSKHCIVGSGSVILPGVILEEACAVGALSLVKSDCEAYGVYAGIPAVKIGVRSNRVVGLGDKFLRKV